MRVLQVGKYYYPYRGGIETYLRSLCRELAKVIEVRAVVANDRCRNETTQIDGVTISRLATWATVASSPICPGLPAAIRSSTADLLHLHLPNPLALAAVLASGYHGPIVMSWHSDIVVQRYLGLLVAPLVRLFLARSSAMIVSSPIQLENSAVLRPYGSKCRVIPYGIETEDFQRADSAAVKDIRRRYGDRLVLGIGRLVYYKGFDHLISAMRRIDGHLLLIGDGPLRGALERHVRQEGVQDKITFLGLVENTKDFLHAADIFVLPSVKPSEAFGIVQLEAMACGKPIVNTRLDSGVVFVSPDRVTGVTVPPADALALADAINRLLDEPATRERYGRAGMERVREHFSVQAMAKATLELYEAACQARSEQAA